MNNLATIILLLSFAAAPQVQAQSVLVYDTTGQQVWSSGSGFSITYTPEVCEFATSNISGGDYIVRVTPAPGTFCGYTNFRLLLDGREYLPLVGSYYTDVVFDAFSVTAYLFDLTGCVRQSNGSTPNFFVGYPIYTYTDAIATNTPIRWDFSTSPGVTMIVDSVDGDLVCDGAALPEVAFSSGFE